MDPEARHYQDQLHHANQERMQRFEDKLDELLESSTRVQESTKDLPKLTDRVATLENELNRAKGVMAVLGAIAGLIGAGIGAAFGALFHSLFRKPATDNEADGPAERVGVWTF